MDEPDFPSEISEMTPALRGAFHKGVKAHQKGHPAKSCPYNDLRSNYNRVTWSRAFREAWRYGWYWAKENHHCLRISPGAGNPSEIVMMK